MTSSDKKSISIRIPAAQQARFASYTDAFEKAGCSVLDDIREMVDKTVNELDHLGLPSTLVDLKINWLEPSQIHSEFVGAFRLKIPELLVISSAEIHRIVFRIPEFFLADSEPFRIDSAHFQRVASAEHALESSQVKRNVLSFRLVDRMWTGSIYVYRPNYDQADLATQIGSALNSHIRNTLSLYLLRRLPKNRIQSVAEVDAADEALKSMDTGSVFRRFDQK